MAEPRPGSVARRRLPASRARPGTADEAGSPAVDEAAVVVSGAAVTGSAGGAGAGASAGAPVPPPAEPAGDDAPDVPGNGGTPGTGGRSGPPDPPSSTPGTCTSTRPGTPTSIGGVVTGGRTWASAVPAHRAPAVRALAATARKPAAPRRRIMSPRPRARAAEPAPSPPP